MSKITDDVIIAQLRETVRLQGEELAELRRLVDAFGILFSESGLERISDPIWDCRKYNRRKAAQCPST